MKKTLILLSILFSVQSNAQQDPHYSMWYASTATLNPSATATMEQDFSFFTNYRGQWLTAVPTPFRTNSFMGEFKLGQDKIQNGWFGLGTQYTNDVTGDAKVVSHMVSIPFNYVWEGYEKSFFSLGIKPGIINRSLNQDFETWDNQWNGIAFDNTILSTEAGVDKTTQFDIGAGIYYKKVWQSRAKFDIGFAANHLNAPEQGFRTLSFQTFRQYIFHTSASFKLERYKFLLSPQLITMFQGPHRDLIIGTSFDVLLDEGSRRTTFNPQKSVGFGLNYRLNDAIIASFMMRFNGFEFGVSYDAALNINRIPTNTVGAVELFVKYAFYKNHGRRWIR